MQIAEKTVLITSANRGIGEALIKEAFNRGRKEFSRAVGTHLETPPSFLMRDFRGVTGCCTSSPAVFSAVLNEPTMLSKTAG